MFALQLVSLAVLATIGYSHAQFYGRVPIRHVPIPNVPITAPCYGGLDDMSALLLLAKATDKSSEVNASEIINKLVNALVFATTSTGGAGVAGGAGGASGSGGVGGSGGSAPSPRPTTKPTPQPANDDSTLIDLGLLTNDQLLELLVAGKKVLDLDVGQGGGLVTNLLKGLL